MSAFVALTLAALVVYLVCRRRPSRRPAGAVYPAAVPAPLEPAFCHAGHFFVNIAGRWSCLVCPATRNRDGSVS